MITFLQKEAERVSPILLLLDAVSKNRQNVASHWRRRL